MPRSKADVKNLVEAAVVPHHIHDSDEESSLSAIPLGGGAVGDTRANHTTLKSPIASSVNTSSTKVIRSRTNNHVYVPGMHRRRMRNKPKGLVVSRSHPLLGRPKRDRRKRKGSNKIKENKQLFLPSIRGRSNTSSPSGTTTNTMFFPKVMLK